MFEEFFQAIIRSCGIDNFFYAPKHLYHTRRPLKKY
jgi:hypothetical protein